MEDDLLFIEVFHCWLLSMDHFTFKNRWPSNRVREGEVGATSQSLHFSPQKNPAKFSHTIPKIDSQRIHPGKFKSYFSD